MVTRRSHVRTTIPPVERHSPKRLYRWGPSHNISFRRAFLCRRVPRPRGWLRPQVGVGRGMDCASRTAARLIPSAAPRPESLRGVGVRAVRFLRRGFSAYDTRMPPPALRTCATGQGGIKVTAAVREFSRPSELRRMLKNVPALFCRAAPTSGESSGPRDSREHPPRPRLKFFLYSQLLVPLSHVFAYSSKTCKPYHHITP